jgi:hypothetical protein
VVLSELRRPQLAQNEIKRSVSLEEQESWLPLSLLGNSRMGYDRCIGCSAESGELLSTMKRSRSDTSMHGFGRHRRCFGSASRRVPTRSGYTLVFGGVEQRPGGLVVYHMVAYYSNVNFGGRCL